MLPLLQLLKNLLPAGIEAVTVSRGWIKGKAVGEELKRFEGHHGSLEEIHLLRFR